LARPHLLVQHIVKQAEQLAALRAQRDPRPVWLVEFVESAAAAFAPLAGVGRVGYDCEPTAGGWEARLYIGSTELVGGKQDGHWRANSFELDVGGLTRAFSRIDEFRWNVAAGETAGSFLTLRGAIGDQPLCVKAYSRPPEHLGPALREYHDGRVHPVE
jgi:hypothetical protein